MPRAKAGFFHHEFKKRIGLCKCQRCLQGAPTQKLVISHGIMQRHFGIYRQQFMNDPTQKTAPRWSVRLAPRMNDIVSVLGGGDHLRYERRIVLQIRIENNHVSSASLSQSREDSVVLAEIPAQFQPTYAAATAAGEFGDKLP